MYIINGIAYAGAFMKEIEVKDVSIIDEFMLLITFNTNEKRIYDATVLFEYPAFEPLTNKDIFDALRIENGIITWLDGEIDIAPESLYKNSYPYHYTA